MRRQLKRHTGKILMTTDTLGGVWTYSLELARALQSYGIEVYLATMGAPLNAKQRNCIRSSANVEVFESIYKLEWIDDPWDDVAAAGEWLLKLENLIQPDINHLNQYAFGSLPWRAPSLIVGHSCVYSWFSAVKQMHPPSCWRRYHREVKTGLQFADRVTAPSKAMLEVLHCHYGKFNAYPSIYNGRNAAEFYPRLKEPYVFTGGRLWDDAKNIRALEKIAGDLPWPVYVAGENQNPNGCTARFEKIHLVGHLEKEDFAEWLGQAAIFALPVKYEPFGLTPLEAGLSGCALILGDIPSQREIWRDTALFVPPDDSEKLLHTLKLLISNSRLRRQFALKAYNRALKFTSDLMAEKYMHLYETLAPEYAGWKSPVSRKTAVPPKKLGNIY